MPFFYFVSRVVAQFKNSRKKCLTKDSAMLYNKGTNEEHLRGDNTYGSKDNSGAVC